jgi:hypothetical protein
MLNLFGMVAHDGWLPMMLHSKTEKESKKRHRPVMCACQLVVRKQYQPKTLDSEHL